MNTPRIDEQDRLGSKDMGASQATGLGSAEAPEPHSGLGPAGAIPSAIPADIAEAVLRMGFVEWGAVGPKWDDEHLADFRDTLKLTREEFKTKGPQHLHGLYLAGTETVLCHTGTSPNSAVNARALAGAWNWLVEQAASAIEAATAGETPQSGSTEGESAAREAGDAQ